MKNYQSPFVYANSAEMRLFLLDAAMSAILVLFLAAISTWESPWIDGPLLALWAMTPQALARFLRSRPWPKSAAKSFLVCLMLVGIAVLIGATGWHFISESIDLNVGIGQEVAIILLTSWASGFFLFQVQTYRLHDALSFGALAIGLVDSRPNGLYWAVSFVFFFFMASPIRHQLFDIHAFSARPRLYLRQGAGLIWSTLAIALLIFVVGEATSRHFIGETGSTWGNLVATRNDGRTIGWNPTLDLSDFGRLREDDMEAYRVRIRDAATGKPVLPPLLARIDASTHWRMKALAIVSNGGATWHQVPNKNFKANPNVGRVRLMPVRNTRIVQIYELERVTPITSLIPVPYQAASVSIIETEAQNISLGVSERGELTAFGADQKPSYPQGDRIEYAITHNLRPWNQSSKNDRPKDVHLVFPSTAEIGFDLRELADEVFGKSRTLGNKIRKLKKFYETSFVYDVKIFWHEKRRRGDTHLKNFLKRTKVGDCGYFAASACLLLRAAGIPSRIVQGYLGMKWDAEEECFLIHNNSAHAWVEFFDESSLGWQVLDATGFVEKRGELRGDGTTVAIPNTSTAKKTDGQSKKQYGVSRLWSAVTTEYNNTRALMVFFGAVGVLLVAAFMKRPRIAPRRGKNIEIDNAFPLPQNYKFPQSPEDIVPTNSRELVISRYDTWQAQLSRWRSQRAPQETPREHAERLSMEHAKHGDSIRFVAQTFCDALFGKKTISQETYREFDRSLGRLKNHLR